MPLSLSVMHKKYMNKLLVNIFSIVGLCVFLVLSIISSSNDKLAAEVMALIGACLFLLKSAEVYGSKIGLETKSTNIKIAPWAIICLILFVIAWVFT